MAPRSSLAAHCMKHDELAREIAATAFPDVRITSVLARTGKSVLLCGKTMTRRVVVKVLTSDDPVWRQRFASEISFYRNAGVESPPVCVPQLLGVSGDGTAMLLEHVSGDPLSASRHRSHRVAGRRLDLCLESLSALACWRPSWLGSADENFSDKLVMKAEDQAARGALTSADVAAMVKLIGRVGSKRQLAHGDMIPTNCLFHGNRVFLVDWEHAGLHLPTCDHALLWVVLHHRRDRQAIAASAQAARGPRAAAFAVNRLLLIAREIRIHQEASELASAASVLRSLGQGLASLRVEIRKLL